MYINECSIPLERAGLCNNDHVFDISNNKCPKCESEHWILISKILSRPNPYWEG